MPGYILHLTAAKILLDKFDLPVNHNDFYIGNLLPDAVEEKTRSHFWTEQQKKKIVISPKLELFCQKYKHLFNDSSVLGYYYHLYVDWKFTTAFYPRILRYLNCEMQEETEKEKTVWTYICKTGEIVPVRQFLSDEYYYGDFTRMNTWLVEEYHLPQQLEMNVKNPGIEEVEYGNIGKVLSQLKGYLDVPKEAVEELKVFDLPDLLDFLENTAQEWYELYVKQME